MITLWVPDAADDAHDIYGRCGCEGGTSRVPRPELIFLGASAQF